MEIKTYTFLTMPVLIFQTKLSSVCYYLFLPTMYMIHLTYY